MRYSEVEAELTAPGAPFELIDFSVNGRPMKAYKNAKASLRDVFENPVAPDRDAIVYLHERLTYSQLRAAALRCAAALNAAGVKKGNRVAIAMRNLPEYAIIFWACQQIGAILVGLNAWWTKAELDFAISDSEPLLLFLDEERLRRIGDEARDKLKAIIAVRMDDDFSEAGIDTWSTFLERATGEAPRPDLNADDPATMLYTSGTTGRPKGVLTSHRAHCTAQMNTAYFGAAALRMAGQAIGGTTPANQPATLQPFPMFHIGGLSQFYISYSFGSKMVLLHKWDADEAARLIDIERITSISLAPAMLRQLVDSPVFHASDHASVTGFATGAAPVSPELMKDTRNVIGGSVMPTIGYGLTESTSGVCAISGSLIEEKTGSVGPIFPVTECRISNPDSHAELAAGEVGEVWLRGPTITDGYWKRAEENLETFTKDGWFRTGDLGFLDEDAFLYLVDRLKDVIIRGGENVYCAEVEAVLEEHPTVGEVAVLGEPDEILGETVTAVVVPAKSVVPDENELSKHVAERLAYFKVPSRFVFRSSPLDRNATGKVDKKALRAELSPNS